MPSGQSNTTWFPELIAILQEQWRHDLTIEEHFKLVGELNVKLTELRQLYDVKASMYWCSKCNKNVRGVLTIVTITAMYFAVERFELCTHVEHLAFKRNWSKYSRINKISIYGKPLVPEKVKS